QQNQTRNVGESSPITNTLGPPVQDPSVICPVPVLMTIYACPRSNVQVHYSCEHSALPINEFVGGLYEPYQTGSYNSNQADWQQVSPVSCGSPSLHHSQNNFIRNELPMPMNEVQQNRTRDVGPITNTFGPPPVQYPYVICPGHHKVSENRNLIGDLHVTPSSPTVKFNYQNIAFNGNILSSSERVLSIMTSCLSLSTLNVAPHQMLVSSGRENNPQNSSTIASQIHWDNANYLNMTSAPELQTAISQTPVHIDEIE
ncbi:34110_t:CDS:2, partial [Gigaspora margarita]